MDFRKLISRFRQFGGMRLVWQYAKLGALWPAMKVGFRCLVKGQSFKGIYPEVLKKVEPFLMEKYGTQILQIAQKEIVGQASNEVKNTNVSHSERKENLFAFPSQRNVNEVNCTNDTNEISHQVRNDGKKTIWWCWLQGIENAPAIVKACYNSLKQLTGYSLTVIDNANWREYVELPGYIVEKWEKGRIPAALFSDLLRVELLIRYGGTWIDSTVLCTGFKFLDSCFRYLDAPLFVFQYTKEGSVPVSISNWFITARKDNEVLRVLREMLYAYWRDYDCVLDYYIFHLFFAMISKVYPEQMAAMPYAQSQRSLVLLHRWGEKFDQRKLDRLTSEVCFHKLAFRVREDIKKDKENYYNYILTEYGRI